MQDVLDSYIVMRRQGATSRVDMHNQRRGIYTHINALWAILKKPGTVGLVGVIAIHKP
jgi:hypothetical protein